MARIKGAVATRKRRKKIMKMAKGFWGAKSKQFRTANAGRHALHGQFLYRQKAEKARFPQIVDYPYQRGGQDVRHELFHLYARPETRADRP